MFHVPNEYRVSSRFYKSDHSFGNNGAFVIPVFGKFSTKRELYVIASDGEGWEHVSAHVKRGKEELTPFWSDMCYLKSIFWSPEDVVMQLHPKESEYVNNHPHVLHLWRPIGVEIPTPPSILVGFK